MNTIKCEDHSEDVIFFDCGCRYIKEERYKELEKSYNREKRWNGGLMKKLNEIGQIIKNPRIDIG